MKVEKITVEKEVIRTIDLGSVEVSLTVKIDETHLFIGKSQLLILEGTHHLDDETIKILDDNRIDENDFVEFIEGDRDELFRNTPETNFEHIERFFDRKHFSNVAGFIGRSADMDFIDFIDSESWSMEEKLKALRAGFKTGSIKG